MVVIQFTDGTEEFDDHVILFFGTIENIINTCIGDTKSPIPLTSFGITKHEFKIALKISESFPGCDCMANIIPSARIKKILDFLDCHVYSENIPTVFDDYNCGSDVPGNDVFVLTDTIVDEIVKNNRINLIKYICENKTNEKYKRKHCIYMMLRSAAKFGKIEIIAYLRKIRACEKMFLVNIAIYYNQFECLKYLCDTGCHLNHRAYQDAIVAGNMEIIKYIENIEKDFVCDVALTMYLAVRSDNLELVKHLFVDTEYDFVGEISGEWDVVESAAENENLEMMKYLINKGCSIMNFWELNTYMIECGNVDILEYVHTIYPENDKYVCINAAKNGNLKLLRHMIEHGFSWNPKIIISEACKKSHNDIIKYVLSTKPKISCKKMTKILEKIIRHKDAELFEFIIKNYKIDEDNNICVYAVQFGTFKMLQCAHENGYTLDDTMMKIAIQRCDKYGYKCLKYLHKNGCNLTNDLIDIAISVNGIDKSDMCCKKKIIQYLIKHKCPIC